MTTLNFEQLNEKIGNLIDNSEYNTACEIIMQEFDFSIEFKGSIYKSMPWDREGEQRHVFNVILKRDSQEYKFKFGQSIAAGNEEPTNYDIIACLTKNDPESFEDFCDAYGYDREEEFSIDTFERVENEWEGVSAMFNNEELEILSLIN